MTKEKKIIIGITSILTLIIVILSYFLINKNAIIEKQAEKIELQAMETNGSNSYTTTEEHLQEVSQTKQNTIENIENVSLGASTSYTIQNTGKAIITYTLHACNHYDCAKGVSRPKVTIKIDSETIFNSDPWASRSANDGDNTTISCNKIVDVTAGQVLKVTTKGPYLGTKGCSGSLSVIH